MRALVTGGAGFIGSNLVDKLVEDGHEVDVVDDLSNGKLIFLSNKVKDESIIISDFADSVILEKIRRGSYSAVFHLAALPSVGYSVEHPAETNDVNVSSTIRLLDACNGNINRFIFASSSAVYGNVEKLPSSIDDKKNPNSPYALQKLIVEDYLKLYHKLYDFNSVSLRFFNVFGKNQIGNSPYSTAVSAWLNAIMRGDSMRSDGDGTQTRDMCHVDNIVEACIKAATAKDYSGSSSLNVACGESFTNKEILQYLLKIFPESKYHDAPWRQGDVMHTLADISETEKTIGYKPIVSFWEGLDRTVEWYKNNWELISSVASNR